MAGCMMQTQQSSIFGSAIRETHKRAASLRENSNINQQASVKKTRTTELSPQLQTECRGRQGTAQQQDITWPGQLTAGAAPNKVSKAFNLLSDNDLEYLQALLEQETKSQPSYRCLTSVQRDIDPQKRLVLVDWLSEVVEEFELNEATLYLAVSVLDRFLYAQEVPRAQLQLLGVTCLWIASKFEDTLPPSLQEIVDITDNSYATDDVLRMEAIVLAELQYQLAVPTSLTFLHQLVSHVQEDLSRSSPCYEDPSEAESETRLVHTAEYVLELALLTPDTLRYRPSVVAASALQVALELVSCDVVVCQACNKLCSALSSVASHGMEECVAELKRMQFWAATVAQPPSIKGKYSRRERYYVGILGPCKLSSLEPAYSL